MIRSATVSGTLVLALGLGACGGKPMTAAEIYAMAQPSVVMIQASPTQAERVGDADGPECEEVSFSHGTGFVIDTSGFIATNAHVADPCPQAFPNQRLTVKIADGETLPATLIGVDQVGDVAVLKVDHTFKTALQFADSKTVRPGQDVVAIGFPGFLDGEATITRGVVSVATRSYGAYGSVVQTDAAVNHGNSGGPLLNEAARSSASTPSSIARRPTSKRSTSPCPPRSSPANSPTSANTAVCSAPTSARSPTSLSTRPSRSNSATWRTRSPSAC